MNFKMAMLKIPVCNILSGGTEEGGDAEGGDAGGGGAQGYVAPV